MFRSKLKSGVRKLAQRLRAADAPPPPASTWTGTDSPAGPDYSSASCGCGYDEPQQEPQPPGEPTLDRQQVERLIHERIRPALQADGGDIQLVEIQGGDVHVRLTGACSGCPSASVTLEMGVEAMLRDELVGFGRVVRVL